jgi:hypothetical protein
MLKESHAALLALAILAACGEEETPATSAVPEEVALDVMIDDGGLEILAVYPLEEWRDLSQSGSAYLGYELRDADGAAIVSGRIPDPRELRDESGHEPVLSPFGVASLRLPAVAGQLVILEGAVELGATPFDPAAVRSQGEEVDDEEAASGVGSTTSAILSPGDIRSIPDRIFGRLSRGAAVDLLIVPEGYTFRQMRSFRRDATAMSRSFLSIMSRQRNYRGRFNIWIQEVDSRSSGIDDPRSHRRADTAFDVTFGTGDNRRCTWFGTKAGEAAARRLGRAARADIVVVLSNTSEHGGCAVNGAFVLTHNPLAPWTMAHELGHALLGLADEYDYGECRHSAAPNVAFSSRRSAIPWRGRIKSSTPLPTPQTTRYRSTIGAFTGASYCKSGAFRPQLDCLMRTLQVNYCAICLGSLDRYMRTLARKSRAGGTPCTDDMKSDGICDVCLEQDPDCRGGNSCGDGTCAADETDESCPEDCGCAASGCQLAPFGCYCDADCAENGDCCADACDACGSC